MQLVLDTKGISVTKRNNCFQLRTDKHERLISPSRVSSIAVWAYCMLSSAAVKLAIQHQIPIYFFDAFGNTIGRLGAASFGNDAALRRQQVFFCQDPAATAWVLHIYTLKAQGQCANLRYLANRKQAQQEILNEACTQIEKLCQDLQQYAQQSISTVADSIRGKEGSMARYYWQALSQVLPEPFKFEGRVQQEPPDAFNTSLNYLYGILYGMVETAIYSVGLDPSMGVLHADQGDKPTLAYDLIEPFRPMADRLLIELALGKEAQAEHFEQENGHVRLSKKGKELLIPAFHDWLQQKVLLGGTQAHTRKNHIYQQAGFLKKNIEEFAKL